MIGDERDSGSGLPVTLDLDTAEAFAEALQMLCDGARARNEPRVNMMGVLNSLKKSYTEARAELDTMIRQRRAEERAERSRADAVPENTKTSTFSDEHPTGAGFVDSNGRQLQDGSGGNPPRDVPSGDTLT